MAQGSNQLRRYSNTLLVGLETTAIRLVPRFAPRLDQARFFDQPNVDSVADNEDGEPAEQEQGRR